MVCSWVWWEELSAEDGKLSHHALLSHLTWMQHNPAGVVLQKAGAEVFHRHDCADKCVIRDTRTRVEAAFYFLLHMFLIWTHRHESRSCIQSRYVCSQLLRFLITGEWMLEVFHEQTTIERSLSEAFNWLMVKWIRHELSLLCSLNGNNSASTQTAETSWSIKGGGDGATTLSNCCGNVLKSTTPFVWRRARQEIHWLTLSSHSKNHKPSGCSITGSFQSRSSRSSSRSGWGKCWSQSCGCRLRASCGRWEYLLRNVMSAGIPTERPDTRTYWEPADEMRQTL